MTWTQLSRIALIASVGLLVGCGSTAKPHDPHMNMSSTAVEEAEAQDVELVGMPGLEDPIPARSVDISALGLSCPLCAHNLDKQLKMIEGVTSADVDLSTGQVRVAFAETACVTPQQLITSVKDAGFSVSRITAVHTPAATE